MGVDGDVFPLIAGGGESLGQACGEDVHFAAQGQHAAHAVDVGFRVQIIFVKDHAAGHLQHVLQGVAVIGGAFERGGVFGDRIVEGSDLAFFQQDAHEGGEIALGHGPADAQVFGAGAEEVILVDDCSVFHDQEGRDIAVFDPLIYVRWERGFGAVRQCACRAIAARHWDGEEGGVHVGEIGHDLLFGEERVDGQQACDLFAFPQPDSNCDHNKRQQDAAQPFSKSTHVLILPTRA